MYFAREALRWVTSSSSRGCLLKAASAQSRESGKTLTGIKSGRKGRKRHCIIISVNGGDVDLCSLDVCLCFCVSVCVFKIEVKC